MLNLRQLNVELDALGSKADNPPLYIISQIKNRLFFPVLAGYDSHVEQGERSLTPFAIISINRWVK
jgi:hypothetical protein